MGALILTKVQDELEIAGFSVNTAYPGQKYPQIRETVAAVHLEKMDGNTQEVTVEVDIVCPASMGGAMCEYQAFQATEALTAVGARCIQNGCVYHAATNTFMVTIHATFAGSSQSEDGTIGPGFQVYINNVLQPHATGFTSLKEADHKVIYTIGMALPEGSTAGPFLHTFQLEEVIPIGQTAPEDHTGIFSIRVETEKTVERFFDCRWSSVQQVYTKEGLKRIRKGIARIREEISNG